ncbi:hypothetical protein MRX96_054245 [Rhipicephalus microplus]
MSRRRRSTGDHPLRPRELGLRLLRYSNRAALAPQAERGMFSSLVAAACLPTYVRRRAGALTAGVLATGVPFITPSRAAPLLAELFRRRGHLKGAPGKATDGSACDLTHTY